MNIEPVKINISNTARFASIAFFVDRDDFLSDILSIRRKYKIVKTKYREEAQKERGQIRKRLPPNFVGLARSKYRKVINFRQGVELEVEKLMNKYHKGWNFYDVIYYTIVSGCVEEMDLSVNEVFKEGFIANDGMGSSCYFMPPFPKEQVEFLRGMGMSPDIHLDVSEVAIIINPETTWTDLKKCFKTVKERMPRLEGSWKTPDTISNIVRDRNWYWLKKSGMSYSQVHTEAVKHGEAITRDGIIKAIKQYKKRLSVEI